MIIKCENFNYNLMIEF